jgi:hypothetical protein
VFTFILLSDTSNHEVVTVFACLLERCRAKESFTANQKKFFSSWLQKLKTLWNPPAIRKANDYKRRLVQFFSRLFSIGSIQPIFEKVAHNGGQAHFRQKIFVIFCGKK